MSTAAVLLLRLYSAILTMMSRNSAWRCTWRHAAAREKCCPRPCARPCARLGKVQIYRGA